MSNDESLDTHSGSLALLWFFGTGAVVMGLIGAYIGGTGLAISTFAGITEGNEHAIPPALVSGGGLVVSLVILFYGLRAVNASYRPNWGMPMSNDNSAFGRIL